MVFHTQHKQVVSPKFKIDEVEKELNILGIVINVQVNWKGHVEYIFCNISRTNVTLNRLEHFLLLHIKLVIS